MRGELMGEGRAKPITIGTIVPAETPDLSSWKESLEWQSGGRSDGRRAGRRRSWRICPEHGLVEIATSLQRVRR